MDARDWPEMGEQVTYTYRGDGKRLERNQYESNPWSGDVTRYHYGLGFDVTNEKNGSDVTTYFAGLGKAEGTTSTLGSVASYAHDHLGSPRSLYDSGENIVGQQEFTPYGTLYMDGIPGETMAFTGHQRDALTGDYFAPFRYYSPDAARWLKRDPLGMVDGPNMYAYVGGNPTNFSDPLGLAAGDWWDPRSYAALGSELNPFNLSGSFGQSALSMGDAVAGLATWDWNKVNAAYDGGILGQTKDADPFTKYGTRGALAVSTTCVVAAGGVGIFEFFALGNSSILVSWRGGELVLANNGRKFFRLNPTGDWSSSNLAAKLPHWHSRPIR